MPVTYTHIGQNKGKPRIFLEGKRLAGCGFTRDARYNLVLVESGLDFKLLLKLDANGARKVSWRRRRGLSDFDEIKTDIPIVDILNASLIDLPFGTRIRAIFRTGEIEVTLHH